MVEVNRVVARFELEIRDFQRSTEGMLRRLDRVQRELRDTGQQGTGAFREIERGARGATSALGDLRGAFAAIIGFQTGRAFLEAAISVEDLNRQLTFLFRSQENANAALARIRGLADQVGASLSDITKGYVDLTAAASTSILTQEETDRIFRALVITARALGRSNDDLLGAIRQVGQAVGSERVQFDELRIIFERLSGAQGLFQRNLDGTRRNLRELTKAGIDAREAFIPFAIAAEQQFLPAMEAMRRGTRAAINDMRNAFEELLRDFVDTGALQVLARAIRGVAGALREVTRFAREITTDPLAVFIRRERLIELREAEGRLLSLQRIEFPTPSQRQQMTNLASLIAILRDEVKQLDTELGGTIPRITMNIAPREREPGPFPDSGGAVRAPLIEAGEFAEIERQRTAFFEAQLATQNALTAVARANDELEASLERTARIIQPLFSGIGAAFSNMAIGVARGSQTMREALNGLLESVSAMLVNQGIQLLLGVAQNALLAGAGGGAAASSGGFATGGAAALGAIGIGNPTLAARGAVTVINVPDTSRAEEIARQEEQLNRQVILNTVNLDAQRGNASPLVRQMRSVMRR